MWHALSVTFTYTRVWRSRSSSCSGMALALLLDTDRRGYGVLRALMTLPLVVPPAVTGMMFLLMLDGSFGVLSYYARAARHHRPRQADPRHPVDGAGRRAARRHLAMDARSWC